MAFPKTWTLFDATGSTGASVLRSILMSPPAGLQLNIQTQSKAKLLATFPEIEQEALAANLPIHIIEGSVLDVSVLEECLEDVEVIFMCIQQGHEQGKRRAPIQRGKRKTKSRRRASQRISCTEVADAVISTLESLRYQKYKLGNDDYRTPTIIQLRSTLQQQQQQWQSFSSTNKRRVVPKLLRKKMLPRLLHRGSSPSSRDMMHASNLYHQATLEGLGSENQLLHCLFVKPPSLQEDADGWKHVGYTIPTTIAEEEMGEEEQQTVPRFADTGRLMVEIGKEAHELRARSGYRAVVEQMPKKRKGRTRRMKQSPVMYPVRTLLDVKCKVVDRVKRCRSLSIGGMLHLGLAIGTIPSTMMA